MIDNDSVQILNNDLNNPTPKPNDHKDHYSRVMTRQHVSHKNNLKKQQIVQRHGQTENSSLPSI